MRDLAGVARRHGPSYGYPALDIFVVVRVLRRCLAHFLGDTRIFPFAPCFGSGDHLNDVLPLVPHVKGVAEAVSHLEVECIERRGSRVARFLIVISIQPTSIEIELRAIGWSLPKVEFIQMVFPALEGLK